MDTMTDTQKNSQKYEIICTDVMEWAANYDGPKFHAMLTDCPYELGFMNKAFDKTGISFRPETWAALAEHLYPGAFLLVFASSRGWHRLACALEDSGLRMHPSIFGWGAPMLLWNFGSGFPKATNIASQIDKAAGTKGEPSDYKPNMANKVYGNGMGGGVTTTPYKSVTPLSQAWEGHRYGLQALKPAVEVILMFQKPYAGKPVDSITETGAGALWIDGARIGTPYEGTRKQANIRGGNLMDYQGRDEVVQSGHSSGRWPANFYLSHLPPIQCPNTAFHQNVEDGIGSHEQCQICHGAGMVEQCKRVGERRVGQSLYQ